MTIALTGAAGNLGRLVAERLIATTDPSQVVLITRRPEAVADSVALGADSAPGGLHQAGHSAGRIRRRRPVAHHLRRRRRHSAAWSASAAIEAAKQAGVGHLFYTSVTSPVAENPAGVVPSHQATEEAMAASGLRWTALRNNLYSEFQVPTIQQAAASGSLVTNAGAGLTSYVTRTDCAAAAAGALLHPDPAQVYDISGPAGVSTRDLADLAAGLRGGSVEVVDVSDEQYVAGLVAAGLPEPVAGLLASFGTATREGFMDSTTSAVKDLTGQDPTPLSAVVD